MAQLVKILPEKIENIVCVWRGAELSEAQLIKILPERVENIVVGKLNVTQVMKILPEIKENIVGKIKCDLTDENFP